jgi:hypothetical protein
MDKKLRFRDLNWFLKILVVYVCICLVLDFFILLSILILYVSGGVL